MFEKICIPREKIKLCKEFILRLDLEAKNE
jgi:hypothetical protein